MSPSKADPYQPLPPAPAAEGERLDTPLLAVKMEGGHMQQLKSDHKSMRAAPSQKSSRKTGPQSYSCKELNSAK